MPPAAPPRRTQDRRVRRTRSMLRRALVELMGEIGYDAITVDQIAERADLTRATFYIHYTNKGHLLADVCDDFANRVIAAVLDRPDTPQLAVLFEHARAEDALMRVLLHGDGGGAAFRRFRERLEQVQRLQLDAVLAATATTPPGDLDLVAALRSFGTVGALAWFLDQPELDPVDAAEIALPAIQLGWLHLTGLDHGRSEQLPFPQHAAEHLEAG